MSVEVIVPDEYMGNVMGDLTSRRGKPMGQESRGNALSIKAMVPLAENVWVCYKFTVVILKDVEISQ